MTNLVGVMARDLTDNLGQTLNAGESEVPFLSSILDKMVLWLPNSTISAGTWSDGSPEGNNGTGVSGESPTLSGDKLVFSSTSPGDAIVLDSEINLIGKTVYALARFTGSTAGQILSHTTDNVQIRFSSTLQTLITGSPNLGGAFAISGQDTTIWRIIKIVITASTAQLFYAKDGIQSSQNSHSVTEFMFDQIGRRGASSERADMELKGVAVINGTLTSEEEESFENHYDSLR